MLTQKIFVLAQSGAEVILWILLVLSILSIAAIIERFLTLKSVRQQSEALRDQLRQVLQSHQLSELEDISKSKDSLETRALKYGLRHVKENGDRGLGEIFNSHALMEKPKLERSLTFLATVGNNAPFIGLLGTVFGIMKAFNDLGVSQGDAAAVMVGIAEALVATAVGLFVAIPAVAAYNYFQKQVKQIFQGLDIVKELCVAYAKANNKGT